MLLLLDVFKFNISKKLRYIIGWALVLVGLPTVINSYINLVERLS